VFASKATKKCRIGCEVSCLQQSIRVLWIIVFDSLQETSNRFLEVVQRQVLWTTKPSSFADVFPPVFPPTRRGRVRLSAAHHVRGNKSPRWQFRQSKNKKNATEAKTGSKLVGNGLVWMVGYNRLGN